MEVFALFVLLDSSLTQEAALFVVLTVSNVQMLVPVLSVLLDFHLLMEHVFKVQLKVCLQQLLVESRLFALLDVLPVHLRLFALAASRDFLFKEAPVYNAIKHAEPAL